MASVDTLLSLIFLGVTGLAGNSWASKTALKRELCYASTTLWTGQWCQHLKCDIANFLLLEIKPHGCKNQYPHNHKWERVFSFSHATGTTLKLKGGSWFHGLCFCFFSLLAVTWKVLHGQCFFNSSMQRQESFLTLNVSAKLSRSETKLDFNCVNLSGIREIYKLFHGSCWDIAHSYDSWGCRFGRKFLPLKNFLFFNFKYLWQRHCWTLLWRFLYTGS